MNTDMTISEMLTYSTVLIKCKYANGQIGSGTGFIINLCNDFENHICVPCLVTNNHVVRDSIEIIFEFCKSDENGNPIDTEAFALNYSGLGNNWISHPDSSVDLCFLPLGPALNELSKRKIKIFYIPLETNMIPSENQLEELCAIEDVVMIGYPIGLSDEYNHKPIVRKGITSTHPKKNYQGKNQMLLDIASFPGSSGSPIFLINEGSYHTSSGINIGNRLYFMGILFAGPLYSAEGDLVLANIPNMPKPLVDIPTNLGIAIKSSEILQFEKMIDSKLK